MDFAFPLSSSDSGILVKTCLLTKNNNAINMISNITLLSNWFCYLFDNVQRRLGGHKLDT